MLAAHEYPSGWSVVGGAIVLSTSLVRSILASQDGAPFTQARQPSPSKAPWATQLPHPSAPEGS
jgi:hypothetical protein